MFVREIRIEARKTNVCLDADKVYSNFILFYQTKNAKCINLTSTLKDKLIYVVFFVNQMLSDKLMVDCGFVVEMRFKFKPMDAMPDPCDTNCLDCVRPERVCPSCSIRHYQSTKYCSNGP